MPRTVTATWSTSAARRGRDPLGEVKKPNLTQTTRRCRSARRDRRRRPASARSIAGRCLPDRRPSEARGPDGIYATPDIHHDRDVVFDEFHRRHHLADALAGQILEIAGFEDRDHTLLDFLTENRLLVRRSDLGQRAGRLIDPCGGFQNLLRGLVGADDPRPYIAGN